MNGLRPLGMRAQVSTSEVHRRTRYLDLDGIPARAAAQPGRADARVRAQPVGRRPDRGAVSADRRRRPRAAAGADGGRRVPEPRDRRPRRGRLRALAAVPGVEMITVQSYSKNTGLYAERANVVALLCADRDVASRGQQQLFRTRAVRSSPGRRGSSFRERSAGVGRVLIAVWSVFSF